MRLHSPCLTRTGSFFVCLKTLLEDFSQANVDAAAELVLGAGAFLIRQPATTTRMENLLEVRSRGMRATGLSIACEQASRSFRLNSRLHPNPKVMLRLKGARNLDTSKALLVDSACYACRPPAASALCERRRSPLQRYVRHLVFESLQEGEQALPEVVKRMRRLPWAESEAYVLKCMLQVRAQGRSGRGGGCMRAC